jgi:hypothetical protein
VENGHANTDRELILKLQTLLQPLLLSFRQEVLHFGDGLANHSVANCTPNLKSKKSMKLDSAPERSDNSVAHNDIDAQFRSVFLVGQCLLRLIILFVKRVPFDKSVGMLHDKIYCFLSQFLAKTLLQFLVNLFCRYSAGAIRPKEVLFNFQRYSVNSIFLSISSFLLFLFFFFFSYFSLFLFSFFLFLSFFSPNL